MMSTEQKQQACPHEWRPALHPADKFRCDLCGLVSDWPIPPPPPNINLCIAKALGEAKLVQQSPEVYSYPRYSDDLETAIAGIKKWAVLWEGKPDWGGGHWTVQTRGSRDYYIVLGEQYFFSFPSLDSIAQAAAFALFHVTCIDDYCGYSGKWDRTAILVGFAAPECSDGKDERHEYEAN